MSTIQSVLDAGPPIAQQTLAELSKGSLREHLHGQSAASVPQDIEALWYCLVCSALSEEATEKYLTTVCNSISVFLLGAASSPLSGVKQFATSGKVWFEGFDCAHKAFHGGKTKPALQVLETLAQLLRKHPDHALASNILQRSSQGMLTTLFTGTPGGQIKSVCIALTCLIKKTRLLRMLEDVVAESLDQVSSSWKRLQLENCIQLPYSFAQQSRSRHLFLALLFAVRKLETRSAALKLFSLLLHSEDWTRGCRPAQSAAEVIELFLREDAASLGDFADNVIPVIMDDQTKYQTFRDLYKPNEVCLESRLILYLSVIKAGRLKKFLSEDALPEEVSEALGHASGPIQTPKDRYVSFHLLLRAGSPSVRAHAYNLLTASFGTVTSVPTGVLQCLLSSFRYLHNDNDAHERGELVSITRRLLGRLESSRNHLRKKTPPASHDENTLAYYDDFLHKVGKFVLLELNPRVSYQRHTLALHLLQLLLKVAPEAWLDPLPLALSLSSLVCDPFDDVRLLAAIILQDLIELDLYGGTPSLMLKMLWDVQSLSAKTCRHDHADAAGRLRAIVISQGGMAAEAHVTLFDHFQRLDEHTNTVDKLNPGSGFALHATLLGLAYGLGAGQGITPDICAGLVGICGKIWAMVQSRLCVDSPEVASDEAEGESLGGPKDLLAYSWRALRDSSLLLQSILRVCRKDSRILARIGWLCMEQLTTLRHRGAFSTVDETFSSCCEQARTSQDPPTRQLNDAWYNAALCEIEKQSTKLTRRSAGLPAMICALLSPSDPETFSNTYLHLKDIASKSIAVSRRSHEDIPLPQVHALNCLKDIMTHARFRNYNERYLAETLELAANNLSSSFWAIRNCSLMLLRACMTRLNPQDLKSPADALEPSKDENSRLTPLTVTISLLEPAADLPWNPMLRSEIIFAGLDLAKHFSHVHSDSMRLTALIYLQMGNTVWAIRDHAARVLAARVVVQKNLVEILNDFSPPPNCSENLLHGIMLLHSYVLESFRKNGDGSASLTLLQSCSWLTSTMAKRIETGCSPYTTAAFLGIINELILHSLRAMSTRDCSEATLKFLGSLRTLVQQKDTFNSFCRSRILLTEVLCLLSRTQHHPEKDQPVNDLLINALAQYPDAAQFILEHVEGLPFTPGLVDLLSRLIMATHAADVRTLAMMRLVSCLESRSDELFDAHAASLYPTVDSSRSCDRNSWDASLRLEACLIRNQLSRCSGSVPSQLMSRLRAWAYRIKVTGKDHLEAPTRFSAAAAMSRCGPPVMLRLGEIRMKDADELMINMLLVIYDQLNDDDEEIRKLAEYTAYEILQALGQVLGLSIPVCALAAREALLDHLVDHFSSEPELPKLAMARLVDESGRDILELRPSCRSVFKEGVSDKLSQIRANTNDLFAEEKQNLYIDDLDEVDKWINVLRRCKPSHLDSDWQSAATVWCERGLDALISLLSIGTDTKGVPNGDQDCLHPLGPTYHPAVLVLFLRVVELAKIVTILEARSNDGSFLQLSETDNVRNLGQKLTELRDTASKVGVHCRVTEALAITPGSKKMDIKF